MYLYSLLLLVIFSYGHGQEVPDITTLIEREKSYNPEDLFSLLKDKKPKDKTELMSILPDVFKDNYVLMYDSKSLQSSSFDKPRAILRSPKSEVILSISNHNDKKNEHNSNVELIYWDKKQKAFKFHEIAFDEKNGMTISKSNPGKCLKCHGGEDPRPNWEPYSIWPGSYGGKEEFRLGRELVAGERRYLDEFIKSSKDDPIYSQLLNLEGHFTPFSKDNDIIGGREARGLLNYKFTESVAKLNFERIVDRMSKNEFYDQFKYATLYTIACTYNETPYPEKLKHFDLYYNKLGPEDIIALYERLGTDTESWSMSFGRIPDPDIQLSTPDGSSQNLTYALLKQDKDLWSFFPNENAVSWKENNFYEFGEDVDCQKLRAKSLEILGKADDVMLCRSEMDKLNLESDVNEVTEILNKALEIKAPVNNQITRGKEVAKQHCSHCHSGRFEQMNFFKNEEKLKKRIIEKEDFKDLIIEKIISGDMPLYTILEPTEQKDLVEYIKSFTREIDTP